MPIKSFEGPYKYSVLPKKLEQETSGPLGSLLIRQFHLLDLQDHLQDLQEHLQDLFQGCFKGI